MIKTVSHISEARSDSFSEKEVLVVAHVVPLGNDIVVCLKLMDIVYLSEHKPCERVPPLYNRDAPAQEEIKIVVVADVA